MTGVGGGGWGGWWWGGWGGGGFGGKSILEKDNFSRSRVNTTSITDRL